MSAVLVIAQDKVQINKVVVESFPFVIGRSSRAELTLIDNMMSREHCKIVSEGGAFSIQDNGSRNGTEVNGKLISESAPLKDGDQIVLGSFQLTFYASGGEDLADEADEDMDETRFVGAGDLDKARKASGPKEPMAAEARSKILVTAGLLKGTVFKDWGADLRIGRDEDNQVVLPDDAVSHRHARVHKEGGNYVIEDLGSANGTFVGGVRLREPQVLKNGDKIRIGTAAMEYSEIDPVRLKKMRIRIAAGVIGAVLLILIAMLFKPEDKAARYAAKGHELLQQKQYDEAIAIFEKGLKEKPTQELKRGLSMARSQAEAQVFLVEAEQAALDENYEEALNICHRVLRLHPNHEEAQAFLAVMTQVQEAQVAEKARNWPDAVRLYDNAMETYPDSKVLTARLARCREELAAESSLAKAETLIEQKDYAAAEQAVSGTADTSAYRKETVALRERIRGLKEAASKFTEAQKAYRSGRVEDALLLVRDGLKVVPDYDDLVKLRTDIEMITPLAKRLEGGEKLLQSDDVDAIRAMVSECDSVANIRAQSVEVDRVKAKASTFARKLKERLAEIATQETWAGDQRLAAGDQRGALIAYRKASAADPANQKAELAAAKLQKELSPLAKEHFQQALVHEELDQIDLAVAEFQEVLDIAVPGDRYYDRAVEKLKKYR